MRILFIFWPCVLTASLLAQPQIGGGTCDSSTLRGTYSLTLKGGSLETNSSPEFLTNFIDGIGTASFDGLSKVTFTLTENAGSASNTPMTLSGIYTLQSDCVGTLNIDAVDNASYVLGVFNSGSNYSITGQDGTRTLTGGGKLIPTTSCSMTTLTGIYGFDGNGFGSLSGAPSASETVTALTYVSGLFQFDGAGNVSANWFTTPGYGLPNSSSAVGTYAVTSACTATATLKDPSGNSYAAGFAITEANGSFNLRVANTMTVGTSELAFIGSGRPSQSTPSPCSVANLSGTYSLTLTGRYASALGAPGGGTTGTVLQHVYGAVGTANFDGNGKVTFNLTAGAGAATGVPQIWSGTYTLPSNCLGTVNITSGDAAMFTLVAYNSGKSFNATGSDASFSYTASGAPEPSACLPATLSGAYTFAGEGYSFFNGSPLAGPGALTGISALSGILHFDGAGAVSSMWTVSNNANETSDALTGTYTVSAASCTATATLSDSTGLSYSLGFSITSVDASRLSVVISNPQLATTTSLFTATGHSTFTNPGRAVELAAGSGLAVSPGSLFSIYGSDLAAGPSQFTTFPLPIDIKATSVTVNGKTVPLYYVDQTIINAQMPLDVTPGVATVVVKNGSATSNSVAISIAATADPGVFIYGNNHAAAQNLPDYSLNSDTNPASSGQTVVVYFTGGGPVQGQEMLVTGNATPDSRFPITEPFKLSVDGIETAVDYIGLVPTEVGGFYQANFVVPNVPAGDHNLVVSVGGRSSNATVISTK